MLNNLSRFFLLISLICFSLGGFFLWERYYNPDRLAFLGQPQPVALQSDSFPINLAIPDLKIDLPVFPAEVINNHWPTTRSGVSFLVSSSVPGTGNSVFYGHNWPRLLGSLDRARPGQIISVTQADSSQLYFVIDNISTVSPRAVEILSPTDRPQLTLYTCTGFFDSQRLVVVAYPQNPK